GARPMMKWIAALSFLLLLGTTVGHAELVSLPGRLDPRLRSLPYSAEQVFLVTGTYGMVSGTLAYSVTKKPSGL
ncbi:hypothetical protein ACC690_39870, partial [Rhizobium johnstonii]